ncbi:MAG: cobalt ECF transporter T component CbiQ [Desulfobacteraceae bacterium]|nr:cobalt ECF transporter T component CbiQ [Desulfobacteraceae bacterium]
MIENENLAFKNSLIHKINPSIRILCAVILSFWVALITDFNNFNFLSGCFVFSLLFVCLASITPLEIFKRLKPLFLFLLMIWVLLPITFNGDTAFKVLSFDISRQGLEYCAMVTIKSITIILFFMAFIATMTIGVMGQAMQKLYISNKFIFLVLMTYRYIFVIGEEYQRLLRAAKIRGFVSRTNIHSYKTYAYISGMLFVRASMRAKRVHQAMICRGFNGKFHAIDKFTVDKPSILFFIAILLIMTIYQWLFFKGLIF